MKKTIAILAACVAALTANAQSLLTDPPIPEAQARAIRAAENAQGLRNSILGGLRHSITDLWSDDYAANVATAQALGAHGAELYQLYQAFFASTRALLVASNDTASVAELDALAARVPALTVNQDGTLTITPPPEPAPEQ
jgi:hypothetical protein